MRECIAFDDVLIVPKYSTIRSRLDTDTSTHIGPIKIEKPLVSSPMDSVTGPIMAATLGKQGGMGVIHRFMTIEEELEAIQSVLDFQQREGIFIPVVPAVGVKGEGQERFDIIHREFGKEIDMLSIDIANGHSIVMKEMIDHVKSVDPDIPLMVGDVATLDGFIYLAELGVDAIRVGIGSGQCCSTRIMTAIGMPLLTSLLDCREAKHAFPNVSMIADGGIRYPADLVKSLVAGADAVMCGSIFAGVKEAPGKIIYTNDGKAWKGYRGAASAELQEECRGGLKDGTCAEGVAQLVPYKGSLERVLRDFIGGLRSGMTYVNARSLRELRLNAEFIRITNPGLVESHAYGTKKN